LAPPLDATGAETLKTSLRENMLASMRLARWLPGAMTTLALVAGWVAPADAREWFVAVGGAGSGTIVAPFDRIQDAVNAAQPGDTVVVQAGTYAESLRTARDGRMGAPVTLRSAAGRGTVVVAHRGRVLTINHAYVVVEGFVLDGLYGPDDTLRISGAGDYFQLRDTEVRHSSRDLIDIGGPQGVAIDGCLIHHALNAAGGRTDAHGIAAGAVRGLSVRNTDIHTFSGDGLQVDPARALPGWNGVTIERSRIWLEPLRVATNGFAAGVVPGENAVDTKANPALPRASILVRDTMAWGFRDGLLTNMAAFNVKENVEATFDGVTVYDSTIAFRLRGPTPGAAGAWVTISNAVVHDTSVAVRYEDNIQEVRVWHSTIGGNVGRAFQAASSNSSGLEVRNLLVLGPLPSEAAHMSNLSVGSAAFVNAPANNYELAAGSVAIDTGVTLPAVKADRSGTVRPQGNGPDVGAYEVANTGR
jgi:hypothetical protein